MRSKFHPTICFFAVLWLVLESLGAYGQEPLDSSRSGDIPDAPSAAVLQRSDGGHSEGQPKRILGIMPNFRAVSQDVTLPALSWKEKFVGATEDSFDYSSLIFIGMLAGVSQAEGSVREFHQGAAGYGRYYWHALVDQSDENYWVEFILPTTLHQDPRYYTLGHGGFVKRTAYSFSRVLFTRTDSGNQTPNASEIVGAGAAAGISYLYYPSSEKTWTKTGQRWLFNIGLDGATDIFREFWPDINHALFHRHEGLQESRN